MVESVLTDCVINVPGGRFEKRALKLMTIGNTPIGALAVSDEYLVEIAISLLRYNTYHDDYRLLAWPMARFDFTISRCDWSAGMKTFVISSAL